MKRLAVSILFILIATSFAPDAAGAFKKFRTWAGSGCDRQALAVSHRNTAGSSAARQICTVLELMRIK